MNDHDELEWRAQERARRQAGGDAAPRGPGGSGFGGAPSPGGTASATAPGHRDAAAYRRIAEALRDPPPVDLPADFAARVARIAAARAAPALPAAPTDPAFERGLTRVLVALFALCAVLAGGLYGARMLAQLHAVAGAQGVQWLALLAGCLGLSWSLDWLRRRAGDGHGPRPA